jgi:hypothetical protein
MPVNPFPPPAPSHHPTDVIVYVYPLSADELSLEWAEGADTPGEIPTGVRLLVGAHPRSVVSISLDGCGLEAVATRLEEIASHLRMLSLPDRVGCPLPPVDELRGWPAEDLLDRRDADTDRWLSEHLRRSVRIGGQPLSRVPLGTCIEWGKGFARVGAVEPVGKAAVYRVTLHQVDAAGHAATPAEMVDELLLSAECLVWPAATAAVAG